MPYKSNYLQIMPYIRDSLGWIVVIGTIFCKQAGNWSRGFFVENYIVAHT